jgi:hypothetical protein
MACAVSGGSHRTPYSCKVPEKAQVWPVIRPSSIAPGRFDLKVLDPADPAGRQLDRRIQIQITADAIPIGTFAARLGEALGTAIAVSHELTDVRISIRAASITLGSLLETLQISHVASVGRDPMLLVTEQEFWDRRRGFIKMVPFSIAVIELRRPELAEQLAAMGCAQILGGGGSVAVVGESLVVRDLGEHIGKFRSAVEALDPQSREEVDQLIASPAAR